MSATALTYQQRIDLFRARHGIGAQRGFKPGSKLRGRTNYDGAKLTRLTSDWNPGTLTGDADIRYDVISLRNRARQMEASNEWVARLLEAMENNVLNHEDAYSLRMNVTRAPDFSVLDPIANDKISRGWKEWCRPECCTEEGEDGFYDVMAVALRSAIRDGGVLIRKIIDPKANRFGFTLKVLEIDYLDHWYSVTLENGNRVTMGVEKDDRGRRVAYHLLTRHPGDQIFGAPNSLYRIRVPASEIIHYFVKERSTQSVGIPWISPSMLRLHHLRQYEIAELVASREAANKGGYFTSERGDTYKGEKELSIGADGSTTETGTLNDSEPGQYDELPPGMKFQEYDPQHPTVQYQEFVKGALLGAAAGMGISYMTLTGDLSQANYSSMRAGSLEERQHYTKIQAHMISHLCIPIFEKWLETSLVTGAVNLPISKYDIFNKPKFTGRRWDWVDPLKDISAALMEIDGGISTRTQWADQNGKQIEDVVAQLSAEAKLFADAGVTPVTPQTKGAIAPKPTEVDSEDPSIDDSSDPEESTDEAKDPERTINVTVDARNDSKPRKVRIRKDKATGEMTVEEIE